MKSAWFTPAILGYSGFIYRLPRHVMYLVPDLSESLGCWHAVLCVNGCHALATGRGEPGERAEPRTTNSERPATRDKANDEQGARGE